MENRTLLSCDYRSDTFKQTFCRGKAMFEFQEVFESHLTATVFVSASLTFLTGYAIAALALCRGLQKSRAFGSQPRAA